LSGGVLAAPDVNITGGKMQAWEWSPALPT